MVGACELATAPTMVAMRARRARRLPPRAHERPRARPAGALDGRVDRGFLRGAWGTFPSAFAWDARQRAKSASPLAVSRLHKPRARAVRTRLSKDEQRGIPPLDQEYGIRDVGSRIHV